VALALFAHQLEGQQGPHRLLGGDHRRRRQRRRAHDGGQIELAHQGDEEEEPADARAKGSRRQTQGPHIGHGRGLGLHPLRPLMLRPPGQAGEALLAKQHAQRVDTDRVAGLGQFPLDVVDGEILLPHRDGQRPYPVPDRGRLRPVLERLKEAGALGGIVPELVTEDPEGPGGVAEAVRHDVGGGALDKEAAQRFVLPVKGCVGGEKEPGLAHGGR